MKTSIYLSIFHLLLSCRDKTEEQLSLSSKFIECNDLLLSCNSTRDYCLFGYKWGSGNDFPNYPSDPCQELSGHVILSPNYTSDCDIFYAYALYEIGHTLGLGHSAPDKNYGVHQYESGRLEARRH